MSDEIEQDFTIYEWINDEFLINVLEAYENQSKTAITLLDHSVKSATLKGDNYASALFRAKLTYSIADEERPSIKTPNKNLSIILKARLDNEPLNEILEEFNVFKRESQVYNFIIKECVNLLDTIQDKINFGPALIYADERVIVMEDLQPQGYKLKNTKIKLNLYECKMVLEKVAKFHACTAVLHSKNPDLFRYHKQPNVTEEFSPLHLVYQNAIKSSIKFIKTIPELQQYVDKLLQLENKIIDKLINIFKNDDNSFKMLNHGDLWINNLMFKHNKLDKVTDVLLVDYQEGFYGSPGIDLNWFFYSSCNDNVLENSLDELIKYYHKILSETLELLKYNEKIPTLDDIKDEIQKKGDHGLITLLCMVPIFIIENKEYANATNIISDTEECQQIRDIVFSNPEYGKLLIKYLPNFIKSGHL